MRIPSLILFDLFGTVFCMDGIPIEDRIAYRKHIELPEWSPLVLPNEWTHLPANKNTRIGLRNLKTIGMVATCSNAPLKVQAHLCKNAGITWDAMVPLEMFQMYKPALRVYELAVQSLGGLLESTMMVTANEKFGDLEAARELGIQACLISRNPAEMRDDTLYFPSIDEMSFALIEQFNQEN